jgi:hypothetical protein
LELKNGRAINSGWNYEQIARLLLQKLLQNDNNILPGLALLSGS